MVVLALETVTPAGSLAVVSRDATVQSAMGDAGRPHAARLPMALVEFLHTHGLTLDDVGRMVVVSGPGSFTGVRIGVACAQGFAVTRGWPLASVSTLDALAEGWRQVCAGPEPRTVLACLDGMRGEVFTAVYGWDGTALSSLHDARVCAPSTTLLEGWAAPVTVVGNGAVRYAAVWSDGGAEVLDALEPLAASAARLAASPLWPLVTPAALRPAYVRRPDVELARDRRARQP
jgi:tRNA threonylcarbamoyladenosine biosynthesis protein TsaB